MKRINFSTKAMLLSACTLMTTLGLISCGTDNAPQSGSDERAGNVKSIGAGKAETIYFYQGKPLQSWNVFFFDTEQNQMLSGAYGALPNGKVTVKASDKDAQQDALTLTWKESWSAGLTLEGGAPLDLREHLADGVLSVDLKVIELAKGGLSFKLGCGDNCERKVPFTEQGFAMMGADWKNIRLPLSCFAHDGDDFSAVDLPFSLDVGGQGEVSIANVAFVDGAQANATCPDYKTVSVVPAMLNEYWARDWWEPRHQEKLQQVQQGNIDLIMLGDSITHGWEK